MAIPFFFLDQWVVQANLFPLPTFLVAHNFCKKEIAQNLVSIFNKESKKKPVHKNDQRTFGGFEIFRFRGFFW